MPHPVRRFSPARGRILSNLSSDFPNAQESSAYDYLLRPFVDHEGANLAPIVGE
jgi:hypothetical protein